MQVSSGLFWVIFVAVVVFMIAAWAFTFLRSETVGSLDCPVHTKLGGSRVRLTIAREGAGSALAVQVRVRMTGSLVVHRLRAADAGQLATLLESAAARMRAP